MKIAGTKNTTAATAAIAADEDASVQLAVPNKQVADRAAGEHTGDSSDADDEQQQVRERLVDPVLMRRELDPERLHAGEEVVAAGARERSG